MKSHAQLIMFRYPSISIVPKNKNIFFSREKFYSKGIRKVEQSSHKGTKR